MFICVLILTILPSVYGILCHYPDKNIQALISSSTVNEFKDSLRENIRGEENDVCYLQIQMIYSMSFIQVAFTNTLEETDIIDGDTSLIADIGKISILQHACSTHDYCDIHFIFDHVQWFVDGKYQETFTLNSASLRARTGPPIGREIIIII